MKIIYCVNGVGKLETYGRVPVLDEIIYINDYREQDKPPHYSKKKYKVINIYTSVNVSSMPFSPNELKSINMNDRFQELDSLLESHAKGSCMIGLDEGKVHFTLQEAVVELEELSNR